MRNELESVQAIHAAIKDIDIIYQWIRQGVFNYSDDYKDKMQFLSLSVDIWKEVQRGL